LFLNGTVNTSSAAGRSEDPTQPDTFLVCDVVTTLNGGKVQIVDVTGPAPMLRLPLGRKRPIVQ